MDLIEQIRDSANRDHLSGLYSRNYFFEKGIQLYKKAIEISGAKIDNSIMIGDNYEADILGAEALGIKTICFNYHKEQIPPSFIQVSELKHIKKYL